MQRLPLGEARPGDIVAGGATSSGLKSAIENVFEMARFLSTLGQNPTDLADLAAYIASVTTTATASSPDLNQHGLTGSWYEPATSGQSIEVEFFPNLVAPGTALVAGVWFTFDVAPAGGTDRERWYTFSGHASREQGSDVTADARHRAQLVGLELRPVERAPLVLRVIR
ncbi:MAG: hypothetical protein M3R40_13920, partial [Pseudomonadota bacterium]|nr:hypothetical protein [Pseudomonadota bacterium]